MTNLDPIVRALREQPPELELLEYEPMRAHCSFRIGGPARALVRPASAEETAAVCRIVRGGGAQPLLIGNGTNLLITDGDVDRIVVQMGERMADVARTDATHLRAGAGIPLARLAQAALGYGLAGLEFAHGIPGSLGGAVSMNAGAYGGEMKDVVVSTRYLDHDLNLCEAEGAAHDFGYRHSVFSDTDCVVLGSTLALTPGDPAEIRARMLDLSERRRSRQPLDLPSAGSTFKRPVGGYAAALIDAAGLKGYAVGGAQVSEKHAGFVVNRGGATFDDVLRLMDHIRSEVLRTSGVELEPEVKIIRGDGMEFLIVSGLSGGGKSRAADVLEDLDFYCVDNMPTALLTKFAELCLATRGRYEKVALVTDIRSQESFSELFAALGELKSMGVHYRILFVEASESAIVRRYKESRRPHPLQAESGCSLPEAVRRESELLAPVRERADFVINTTGLTLAMLQKRICEYFADGGTRRDILVNVVSFGFKYGIPIDADLVFDVRFLPNPFYVEKLRPMSGMDAEVQEYVLRSDVAKNFLSKLTDMVDFLLPQYAAEGRYALTIGIGCTGGQHRSVAVAKVLTDYLAARDANVRLRNRDFPKT